MDEILDAVLPYDDASPEAINTALAVDRLIQKFLAYARADDEIEVFTQSILPSPDFYVIHSSLYEEVIARGRDGVFIYAVPTEKAISGEQREP